MSKSNVAECVEQCGNLLKNIFSFIRNCVSSNEFEDCREQSTSAWQSNSHSDAYLENKYKRIKIVCDPRENSNSKTLQKSQENDESSSEEGSIAEESQQSEAEEEEAGEEEEENSENEEKQGKKEVTKAESKEKDKKETEKDKKCVKEKKEEQKCEFENSETETETEDEDEVRAHSCRKRKLKQSKKENSQKAKRQKRSKTKACERVDRQLFNIIMTVRQKTLKKKLEAIERRACDLWQKYSLRLPQCNECNVTNSHWNKLRSFEKFSFYWAIMAGDFFHESPFDNFTRFYLEENEINKSYLRDRKFLEHLKRFWDNLDKSVRMPFIMEAFLFKVSQGKINLRDDCNIRDALDQLYAENC